MDEGQTTKQEQGVQNKEGEQQGQQASQQQQQQQQQQPAVDTEKIKAGAVEEYLQGLGFDDETLKGILAKHKEQEDASKTDLQKIQDVLDKTTKKLAAETKLRIAAEAKVAAIKLGAKTELVDDLVTIASARVTKDKSIEAVIAEIKAGETGSVYFGDDVGQPDNGGKNLTGGTQQPVKKQQQGQGKPEGKSSVDSLFESLLDKRKKEKERKRYYFG